MKKAQLTVVRFDAEDVIATSYFAVPNGGNYDLYTGNRSIYVDGKGYYVPSYNFSYSYTGDDFNANVANNIGYTPMYAAFFDNDTLYATRYQYNTNTATVGGSGAQGDPGLDD